MRTGCDNTHNSARTMPSSWDFFIQVVTVVLSMTSETHGRKLLFYLYYSTFLPETNNLVEANVPVLLTNYTGDKVQATKDTEKDTRNLERDRFSY